jgi:hypothetical protein
MKWWCYSRFLPNRESSWGNISPRKATNREDWLNGYRHGELDNLLDSGFMFMDDCLSGIQLGGRQVRISWDSPGELNITGYSVHDIS